ncbi:uncharacterized protein LOC119404623 isoform X3 [Rhipicephalus sanguineus]|uniref:uncharacterized protein LOC119404623 isoform X3 n=1 Tax=Rhipicephalus sanguineus TaxID=34632 RepID=UPI001895FFD6|nr:uncharacterized protein LOC119404623 isoform X3 [Rhipicephalus sanguineus]
MALQCAVYRNALLLCRITRASLQAGAPVPRLAKPAGRGCSHFVLPQRQMSRLASPAYLSPAATMPKQAYDYFLVLDFEATCSAEKGVPTPQLTGIVQDMVDDQPHLHQVLSRFDDWMREQGLLQARTVFVTFGDWDLQKMRLQSARVTGPRPCWMHCASVGCLIWDATTAALMTAATWHSLSPGWHPVATSSREPMFKQAELSQKAAVGHDLAACTHKAHGLTGAQPPTQHEKGDHQRR